MTLSLDSASSLVLIASIVVHNQVARRPLQSSPTSIVDSFLMGLCWQLKDDTVLHALPTEASRDNWTEEEINDVLPLGELSRLPLFVCYCHVLTICRLRGLLPNISPLLTMHMSPPLLCCMLLQTRYVFLIFSQLALLIPPSISCY
jgi:hypothetical protein